MKTGRLFCVVLLVAVALIIPVLGMAQQVSQSVIQAQNDDEKGRVTSLRYVRATAYQAFDNMNGGGVSNGPTAPTTFALTQTSLIVSIQTYHWNNGAGATLGTIKLTGPNGVVYGPWTAQGVAGQGGKFWVVTPNVELAPGTYTVVDSSNATWSHNAESKNKGFAKVSAKK
jgi:hypothetical protein